VTTFKSIANAFRAPQVPKNADASIDPGVLRTMVASRSHGNVRLQDGRFYTHSDLDAEFEALRGADLRR
jgi:hypothetical protein